MLLGAMLPGCGGAMLFMLFMVFVPMLFIWDRLMLFMELEVISI